MNHQEINYDVLYKSQILASGQNRETLKICQPSSENINISNEYFNIMHQDNQSTNHPEQQIENQSQNQGEVFKFPLSNEGIQSFSSIKQMKQTFISLFDKTYGNSKTIKWTFYFVRSRFWKELNRKYKQKMEQIWKMRCNVCTSVIVYGRKQGSKEYYLLKINYFHMHASDITQYLSHLKNHEKFRYVLARIQTNKFSVSSSDQASIIEFIKNLPTNLNKNTIFWIVKKYFSISESYFFYLLRKMNQKYQISFKKLVSKLSEKGYEYRYLPKDLLQATQNSFQEQGLVPEQIRNSKNPRIPNILIIVTPQMKQQYKAFGQWVGFDLTFSVVRQRTEDNGQYMLGVFGGSNHSKKILMFGLVVTNSQSSFAYSYIFKQFFQIMGSVPQIIITDQQKAIFYSLKHLKEQGIFTGQHLFDMFHMLRKFRKRSYDSQTFQLIRKLIHAKDRFEYRHILRNLQAQVVNEKELDLIRNFDMHAEQYCYSQTPPKFTGIGISNNVNQFFHSLIKNQIRVATKLTNAIQIVMDLIERRIQTSHKPLVTRSLIESLLNMPFLKNLKSSLSEKAYAYIVREVSQCPTLKIVPLEQELTKNLIQTNSKTLKQLHYLTRDSFYVQSEFGYYIVSYKKNEYLQQQKQEYGRWHCNCQHTQRCGYPCSHLSKILILLGLDFLPYVHKRWILDPSAVQAHLQDGESNLKLKRTYEKAIHKFADVRVDHFDIDGYKKCKKRLRHPYEILASVRMARQQAQEDKKTTATHIESPKNSSQISDYLDEDEEDSIIQKEMEHEFINLIDQPQVDPKIERANRLIEGERAKRFESLIYMKPQGMDRGIKIKKTGKGKPKQLKA